MIAVDRQILGNDPLNKLSLDSINAFDALLFSLQSDPQLPVPDILKELKSIFSPMNAHETVGQNAHHGHNSDAHHGHNSDAH